MNLKKAVGQIIVLTALCAPFCFADAAQPKTQTDKGTAQVKGVKKTVNKSPAPPKADVKTSKASSHQHKALSQKAQPPKKAAEPKKAKDATDAKSVSDRRHETQKEIKKLESSVKENQAAKLKLEKELALSAKEIQKSREGLKKIQRDKRNVEVKLAKENQNIDVLKRQIENERSIVHEATKQRLAILAKPERPSWMSGDRDDFRNNALLEVLTKQSEESIRKLAQQEKELRAVVAQSEKSKIQLEKVADKELQERKRLESERSKRQKVAAQLQDELNRQKQTLAGLKRDEKRLEALLARIEKQESEGKKKIQIAKKGEEGVRPVQTPPTPTATLAMAGSYRPVSGPVAAKFGQKREVSGASGKWNGVVFSVRGTQPVKAVRAGKVVFADYLKGYGNMIILDHRNGYFSVYGNNAELLKDIGDEVRAGETISTVGGQNNGLTILYFELRKNGRPVDPSMWLKL